MEIVDFWSKSNISITDLIFDPGTGSTLLAEFETKYQELLPLSTLQMSASGENLAKLLTNVHLGLKPPGCELGLVKGCYDYYHYGCDSVDDRGWGCGYRTLQSLCSWVKYQKANGKEESNVSNPQVPSILQIQEALVAMGDKSASIKGSKDWIGSFEVCLCLDFFYDIPCKIVHVRCGADLPLHLEELLDHFERFGSPLMMGGDSDNASKGVFGVCRDPPSLLVVDPHFYGAQAESRQYLQDTGWVKWRPLETFTEHSFYNICLPQLKASEGSP